MRNIIRKTIVLAFVTTFANVSLQVIVQNITIFFEYDRFAVVAASINSFMNLLLVVLSFKKYQKMLTSLCSK